MMVPSGREVCGMPSSTGSWEKYRATSLLRFISSELLLKNNSRNLFFRTVHLTLSLTLFSKQSNFLYCLRKRWEKHFNVTVSCDHIHANCR